MEEAMNASEIRQCQCLVKIIDSIPESKLEGLLDFASYLQERSQAEDFLSLQSGSSAYQDWLGPKNDIYDQVFKDEPETR
ncbi:MAG: hypothetical protein EXR54_00650 [Dehalococcoidia bacterium]|nr:hypothetical protein [Dehalococcoidia bacterium]